MSVFFSFLGLIVLIHRLGWRRTRAVAAVENGPQVSIIVPARNEEENLAKLLPSLLELSYPNMEILVVDDGSTDQTTTVATSFGVRVVAAGPKPAQWVGKNWACAKGAEVASGDLLLFTDADTIHERDGLARAVAQLRSSRANLLTAPPFHIAPTWWEKMLGLFHVLPLILTAYRHTPSTDRKYSIGQYLLFERACYEKIGGHAALRSSLTEDIDLAHATIEKGFRLIVFEDAILYRVRMFDTFDSFAKGWIRLLRLGMSKSNVGAVAELLLVIQLFVGPNSAPGAALKVAAISFLVYRQRHFGEFSGWGAIFFPFSLVLFTGLSVAAALERITRRPVVWRDRHYEVGFEVDRKGARNA